MVAKRENKERRERKRERKREPARERERERERGRKEKEKKKENLRKLGFLKYTLFNIGRTSLRVGGEKEVETA